MHDDRFNDSAEIQELRSVEAGEASQGETPGRVLTALLWPPIPTLECLPRMRSSFGAETNYIGEPPIDEPRPVA